MPEVTGSISEDAEKSRWDSPLLTLRQTAFL